LLALLRLISTEVLLTIGTQGSTAKQRCHHQPYAARVGIGGRVLAVLF